MHLESIKELYYEAMLRPIPSFLLREIKYELEEHADPELMCSYYLYALRETACAPRPSWKYTQAIIARLTREQVPMESLPLW